MPRELLVLFVLALLGLGCNSRSPRSEFANQATPGRIRLDNFVDYFSTRLERAADEIAQQESDPSIDRNTVYWKMRAIPLAQRALWLADDQAAVLRLWVVSSAMVVAFDGNMDSAFGASQSIAQEAVKDIEARVLDVAGQMLTPEQFKQTQPIVAAYVKAHLGQTGLEHTPSEDHSWAEKASSILRKPISVIQAPLSSLNPAGGLSDTALAVQSFTDEFHRARVELDYMPSEVRWNTQLLLMEMEETINLASVATGVAQIGTSAESLAATARSLPAELRTELTTFAEALEKNQPNLEAALREANTTLTKTEETAQALNTMSATMVETFRAFTDVMKSFEPDPNAPPKPPVEPEDEGPPFDINDYGRTAEKLTETAHALTALFGEFEKVTSASEPPPLLVDTEASLRTLVDRLLLGLAGLVLFTAAVAYGYRVALKRGMRA
jgi:hypothetical protein